jgi:transcriptional regulator with XRE-family HTH domain
MQQSQHEIRRRIGRRLGKARQARGLALSELAVRSGLSIGRLRGYEAGWGSISVAELEQLAGVLRLPPDHFLDQCLWCGSDR